MVYAIPFEVDLYADTQKDSVIPMVAPPPLLKSDHVDFLRYDRAMILPECDYYVHYKALNDPMKLVDGILYLKQQYTRIHYHFVVNEAFQHATEYLLHALFSRDKSEELYYTPGDRVCIAPLSPLLDSSLPYRDETPSLHAIQTAKYISSGDRWATVRMIDENGLPAPTVTRVRKAWLYQTITGA